MINFGWLIKMQFSKANAPAALSLLEDNFHCMGLE
jgi:hypothetical protein